MTPSYRPQRSSVPRREISPGIIQGLAREFASERLSGLPGGQAWFKAFKKRGEKIAREHGLSWSEVYPEIHRLAHEVIARGPEVRPRETGKTAS